MRIFEKLFLKIDFLKKTTKLVIWWLNNALKPLKTHEHMDIYRISVLQ